MTDRESFRDHFEHIPDSESEEEDSEEEQAAIAELNEKLNQTLSQHQKLNQILMKKMMYSLHSLLLN